MDETKQANKKFFNLVADVYENVDTRRGEAVSRWLGQELFWVRQASGDALLDVGCGTGFVMRKANKHFKFIVGVDISREMLKQVKVGYPVCADLEYLPFKEGVFDAVTAVAVLHHVPRHRAMFMEIKNVLRKGGVFYSDHDIDCEFVRRFGWLVKLRRRFCDNSIGYTNAKKDATKELYDQSEIHHDGIPTNLLLSQLQDIGFRSAVARFHWLGLSTLLNKLFWFSPFKYLKRGYAPNTALWVIR